VRLLEDPESAREKRVIVTPKGERFLAAMAERGRAFLQKVTAQLAEDQVRSGVEFLRAGVAAFERVRNENTVKVKSLPMKQRELARGLQDSRTEKGPIALSAKSI
jgi:hypothetical protein